MAYVRIGGGGCGHCMVCVLVVAVGAAVVVIAVNATIAMVVAAIGDAMLMGRMLAVAVDRRQPQNGCRHGGGYDDF
jgi:hypothetical protein